MHLGDPRAFGRREEKTVVRADEEPPFGVAERDGSAYAAHTGIDDREVHAGGTSAACWRAPGLLGTACGGMPWVTSLRVGGDAGDHA